MKKLGCVLFLGLLGLVSSAEERLNLHEVEGKWSTVDGKSFQFSELKGTPVVVGMIYTGCAHACPLTLKKLREFQGELQKRGYLDVKVVAASFDVKGDTPKRLKDYQKERKYDENFWMFLSAPQEKIARQLAVHLGISYKDLGDGDFSHSNVITLFDAEGKYLASIDHLSANISEALDAAGVRKK